MTGKQLELQRKAIKIMAIQLEQLLEEKDISILHVLNSKTKEAMTQLQKIDNIKRYEQSATKNL